MDMKDGKKGDKKNDAPPAGTEEGGKSSEAGGSMSLEEMEQVGRPLADAIEQTLGGDEEGAEGGAGDVQPLVDKLDVTPEHAQALYEAAMASEQYAGMSAGDLADLLASDPQAMADLERRVEEAKGAPEPPPAGEGEGAPQDMSAGDVTDSGTALWPGAPQVGKKGKKDETADLGTAAWPQG